MRLFLQNVRSRTSRAMREEMKLIAMDTAELAEKMAPEEYGDLVGSIDVVEQASSSHRYHVSVVAGGTSKAGIDVSQYAAIMHENYESIISDPETIARKERKERRTGEIVGSKFLERALERQDADIANRLGRVMTLIGGRQQ